MYLEKYEKIACLCWFTKCIIILLADLNGQIVRAQVLWLTLIFSLLVFRQQINH